MALLTRDKLLGASTPSLAGRVKTAAARGLLLKEAAAPMSTTFDVFLSHSTKDAREVLAIKRLMEGLGYSVYVDWVEDEELDRSHVSPRTAARLRRRIAMASSLLVHATEGAQTSRWVPWELGVADGSKRLIGIIPVVAGARSSDVYEGSEYLGLYPYVDFAPGAEDKTYQPWVNTDAQTYVSFAKWLRGVRPSRRV